MKKIVSFFAFVAIVFGFVACGGNNDGNAPVIPNFGIKPQALANKGQLVVQPANADVTYLAWATSKNSIGEFDLRYVAEQYIGQKAYSTWSANQELLVGKNVIPLHNLNQNAEYVAFACYVKPDEFDNTVIDGELITQPFKTMPAGVLNGAFSVSDTKRVYFRECNYYESSNGYVSKPQWWYLEISDDSPRDLFEWSTTQKEYFKDPDHCILEAKEWYYLFRERPNADHLFAQATVNNNEGLIILPDNWNPDGLKLTTGFDMGVLWDAEKLNYEESVHQVYFNGYNENKISETAWEAYELAGAVFLPASKNYQGEYWSSTDDSDDNAFYLHFGKWYLHLRNLSETVDPKSNSKAIRPVYVIR